MKAKSYVIKPHLNETLPEISYGKGIYLYDSGGKQYIDACSGAVTAGIGHGVEEIRKAMADQAEQVSFVYRSQFTSRAAEELAGKLSEWAPGDLNWSFFVNSGSEATETAMKIAIQYWQEKGLRGKNKVISRWMSYHGITMGALSMSGHVLRRRRFIPLLDDLPAVSPPYCYRCPYDSTYPSCKTACLRDLETAIHRIGAENIAAFIAEPVIGAAGGAVVPPMDYYQEVKRICSHHNILFIADEVMSGMGRTGAKFAVDHWGVVPDLIAVGKGLSAGYAPIAATIVSDKIIDTIAEGSGSIMAGHTYSAHPQSAAAALAVIRYMEKHHLVRNARAQGIYLLQQLQALAQRFSFIGDVRGLGLLAGLEFISQKDTKQPFPLEFGLTDRIVQIAREEGLLIYPASGGINGTAGDSVILAPPLTVTKDEIDLILSRLEQILTQLPEITG